MNNQSERTSILLPDLRGGGAERISLDLAREFERAGHRVEFVVMSATGEFVDEARQCFSVVDLAVSKTRNLARPLARYLRTARPRAMIANMWPLTSAAVAAKALSGHSCSLMLVEHNTLTRQYADWGVLHRLLMKTSMMATYCRADRVAAVSEGAALDMAALAGLPLSKVSVLHNPIPMRPKPDQDVLSSADDFWGVSPGARILHVGSLKEQKNHRLLLAAFARLNRPGSRMMLVGQGEYEPMLRAYVADLDIADRVIFAGFHPDPTPFYCSADLFVLSSDYEGLPTVLIEALSHGVPVVSTDCPSGPAEILEDGKYGRLVPVGDAPALAKAMEEALAAPVDRAALKRRAADFAPEIAARKYLDLLGLS